MVFSKALALEMCALNEAAYVLATTGTCTLPAGFSAPVAIRMPVEHRPLFLVHDPLDIWGYATERGGTTYLVFRGTEITSGIEFAQEWAQDALALPLLAFGKGHVHTGFLGAWKALRPAVQKLFPVKPVSVGHSLGGAIATLCWAEMGGELMTFGCPRVGDPDFAKSLWDGQVSRVINAPDIVPRVPTDPPFRHGGYDALLDGPGSFSERKTAHALESYRTGLEQLP